MNAVTQSTRVDARAIEAFLIHEARLLDERRFEEWMDLFSADGYYWAPARPDQADPWGEVSLIFDDREIMKNRIQRLRHPKVYAQLPHSRAVRQLSNISVDEVDAAGETSTIGTRSVFFMLEHRPSSDPSAADRANLRRPLLPSTAARRRNVSHSVEKGCPGAM